MGIIIRQSARGTILTYIGTFIGFITTGVIIPKVLSTNQVGLTQILIAYTLVFVQLGSLGFNNVTTRMFTYFRDDRSKHNGFLFIALTVTLTGFLLCLCAYFIIKPVLIERSADKSALFVEYIYYLIPLVFFTMIFNTLDNYYKVLYNAVIGIILKELVARLFILATVIMYFFDIITFSSFILFYIISYCSPTVIIIISLIKDGQFNLVPKSGFVTKELAKTMSSVALFGIISGFAGVVTLSIDRIMINDIFKMGLDRIGVYGIAFLFGTVIILPSRSLLKISSAIIADAWKENNMETLKTVYCKSCLNQFIIAALLYIGVLANLHNIFKILPEEYADGMYVIVLIGLAYLIDMTI